MKTKILIALVLISSACSRQTANVRSTTPLPSPKATATSTPIPSPSVIKNADYPGKGKITKINLELGSVEMDHEEIVGVMPPMRMEFYVSDKKMLDGLEVGDDVDFTMRYKDATETIIKISKTK